MDEPFLAMIILFAGNFAPIGWALCEGQLLAINQNQALFSLLGTNYGGNGTTNFGLPDLNGNIAIGAGTAPSGTPYDLGQMGGENAVTINQYTLPAHTHQLTKKDTDAGSAGKISTPNASCDLGGLSKADGSIGYQSGSNNLPPVTALDSRTISISGGSQAHENRQPFLTVYYGIAIEGIFPQRP